MRSGLHTLEPWIKERSSLLILFVIIAALLLFPLRILSLGYMPLDDALRHAAFVFAGKSWPDIVVMRDGFSLDFHPGWHWLLGLVQRLTHAGVDGLLFFEVFFLCAGVCLIPLTGFRRPEAWLFGLLLMLICDPEMFSRFLAGRPYLISIALMLVWALYWQKLETGSVMSRLAWTGLFILGVMVAAWVHGSWYFLLLPAGSLGLTRHWRAAILYSMAAIIGILIGASLTGHPLQFLWQSVHQVLQCVGTADSTRLLVGEMWPWRPQLNLLFPVVALWYARRYLPASRREAAPLGNPVFVHAACISLGGMVFFRFWSDWGYPVLLVWAAREIQCHLEMRLPERCWTRLSASGFAAAAFFLISTGDGGGRWSNRLTYERISADNPEHAAWLPPPGGIIYSADMDVFYETFFANPTAGWKYVLGFEPGLMRPDDLKIYRQIQWNSFDTQAYKPWEEKMRMEDRLVIRARPGAAPDLPSLAWNYVAKDTWIGRKKIPRPPLGP